MNTKQPPLREYMMKKAARMKVPISGTFELTPRCNFNCRMCYIRMSAEEVKAKGGELTAQDWIRLGKECRDQGMLFLLLTGGEPFLRPDFREIYTQLWNMGLLITINSNGSLLDDDTVRWLAQMPPMRVNVTLYGGSNETYRRLCGNPHGFDQAVQGIRRLKAAGITVVINASFTRANADDLDLIYDFAQETGVPVRPSVYMFPPVRKTGEEETDREIRVSPQEAGRILLKTKERSLDPSDLTALCQRVCSGLPDELNDEDCTRTDGERMGCMAGKSAFWVTWNGRMTPCGLMNHPAAKPFETGFASAWDEITRQVESILLPTACGNCQLRKTCMVCAAVAAAEGNGDPGKKPEYMCTMTESYAAHCKARLQEEKV